MKRITIFYKGKEEVKINQYPELSLNAIFGKMINFLRESKSLGLDQNDVIEISRYAMQLEMGISI